jgi:hypothetical protein
MRSRDERDRETLHVWIRAELHPIANCASRSFF